jgi:hypothetical protein
MVLAAGDEEPVHGVGTIKPDELAVFGRMLNSRHVEMLPFSCIAVWLLGHDSSNADRLAELGLVPILVGWASAMMLFGRSCSATIETQDAVQHVQDTAQHVQVAGEGAVVNDDTEGVTGGGVAAAGEQVIAAEGGEATAGTAAVATGTAGAAVATSAAGTADTEEADNTVAEAAGMSQGINSQGIDESKKWASKFFRHEFRQVQY